MENKIRRSILFGILLFGFILRCAGINFGLPFQFHQDEPIVVSHALAYGSGDLNPHFFIIPPLTSYLLFLIYGVYYLVLLLVGSVLSPDNFVVLYFKDPTVFYILGRFMLGVIPSMGSIVLTYLIAKRLFNYRVGLYSAFAMAVIYLNVSNAHYVYADNLLVCMILATSVSFIFLEQRGGTAAFLITGVLIGIASAVKYNAALLIIPALVIWARSCQKSGFDKIKQCLVLGGACLIGFILCNPYALLDVNFFVFTLLHKVRNGYIGFSHHLVYSLFEGAGSIFVITGISGLILCALLKAKKTSFLYIFPAVFYMHLVFASQPYSRYVLALIPFICIGAGYLFFNYLYEKSTQKVAKILIAFFAILVLVPSATKSFKADSLFMHGDTRTQAYAWITKNIPLHSRIVFDHTFFRVPLDQTTEQLNAKKNLAEKYPELRKLKSSKLEFQIQANAQKKFTYETFFIVGDDENVGEFMSFSPGIRADISLLKNQGIEYVILSNMKMSPEIESLRLLLSSEHDLVALFSPYTDGKFRKPWDEIEITCLPLMSQEMYNRSQMGPCLQIFKLKK